MNNRLEAIVDLKKYPIQDLNNLLIKEVIKTKIIKDRRLSILQNTVKKCDFEQ